MLKDGWRGCLFWIRRIQTERKNSALKKKFPKKFSKKLKLIKKDESITEIIKKIQLKFA